MIKLARFIQVETKSPKTWIISMAALSGVANGIILMAINVAADNVHDKAKELVLLVFLLSMFLIYVYALHYALSQSLNAVEDGLEKIKIRIAGKIRNTSLRFMEEHQDIGMYSALIQDTNMITEGVVQSIYTIQNCLMLIVTGMYLTVMSPLAFVAVFSLVGCMLPIYLKKFNKTNEEMERTAKKEGEFLNYFNAVLKGFKELKLNQRESDDIYLQLRNVSKDMQKIMTSSNLSFIFDMIFSSSIVFAILLVTVFIVPSLTPTHSDVIHSITSSIIFIMGPLVMLATGIPVFAKTNNSIERLYTLEAKVDSVNSSMSNNANQYPLCTEFKTLEMEGALFHYRDASGDCLFTSGPHSFKLEKGSLLFIVGGNGSGKSTFLKLLTGLYQPEEGSLYLDGELLESSQYPAYRELFSIVFTDFHLFDRIYGLPDLNESDVNYWLKEMKLEKKTQFHDYSFTNINLSTGQKKRLAFIVAVLRNHPICIFDELAADQDPQFRQYFYETVLPRLKKQGRTIIVVSHDEPYFHCADSVLRLEDGKIKSLDLFF
ncbi:MAG: cyclic peptide export ABC transporter [Methylococcales bacterium]|nr:cyclic peptide export ABC transporter [Methylococcales bacterium]